MDPSSANARDGYKSGEGHEIRDLINLTYIGFNRDVWET